MPEHTRPVTTGDHYAPPDSPSETGDPTFQDRFCEYFACDPCRYQTRALRRGLFLRARLIYWMMHFLRPDFFYEERKLVETIGRKSRVSDIKYDIDFYQHKYVSSSTRRGILHVRISGNRLLRLVREVYGPGYREQP
ncbi:MAG: hypothetical protein JJT96_00810 [Opitutales bacterium]|nr:hypothetical protein [Opitutales bacterium]